jgi:hypothetical protein
VQILRRALDVLAGFALRAAGAPIDQPQTTAQGGSGVSTQQPVPAGSGAGTAKPPAAPAGSDPPNTGSRPRLLFLVGVAPVLLGVGPRLRTADAEPY